MATLPGTTTPTWAYITEHGYNFGSILRALKVILLTINPTGTLTKEYPPNFQGITEALADVAEMLQGHLARSAIWPPPSGAPAAPGSGPNQLAEGSLWWSSVMGRLFIKADGQWWQTNGAESLCHVGPFPPQDASGQFLEQQGRTWFRTTDARNFIYVDEPAAQGEPGWYQNTVDTDFELAQGP